MIRGKVQGTGTILAAAALVVAVVTGCSSSSKGSSSSTTGAAGSAGGAASSSGPTAGSSSGTASSTGQTTITVGVLTDATGVAAASYAGFEKGVRAGIAVAPKGYNIKYVLADTGSTPAGALSGAQKLVEEDHVFAVLGASAFTFDAAPFLASHGIPVIGAAGDASEWATDKNMFAVLGATDYSHVFTEAADILKKLGATNLGTVSNPIPSAAGSAKFVGCGCET